MSFFESFKQALSSLASNKLRTALTMLGIVMGVFSLVTIVAISDAAKHYMSSQFDTLGASTITVSAGNSTTSSMMSIMDSSDNATQLKYEDMELIKRVTPEVKNIMAAAQSAASVKTNNYSNIAIIQAVTSQYRSFTTLDITQGRFFTDTEINNNSPVVLIDSTAANKMFGANNPIGQKIEFTFNKTTTKKFTIIGVIEYDSSTTGMMGVDFPLICAMPLTTVMEYNPDLSINQIQLTVAESDNTLTEIAKRIEKFLNFTHGTEDDYSATTSEQIMETINDILDVVSSVLLVIAIITLIVGGIGIVNILLVSVTERIREIGVRKALGAKSKDITLQFLTESIIMTALGGLLGIGLGIAAGWILASMVDIPPSINYPIAILAFLGSIALGLLFGVYPAKKAAELDPIEALRYE